MKRLIFVIAIFILIIVFLYSLPEKEMIPIPADLKHIITTDVNMCFGCHEDNEDSPIKEPHTADLKCFECHKRAEKINEDKNEQKNKFEIEQ